MVRAAVAEAAARVFGSGGGCWTGIEIQVAAGGPRYNTASEETCVTDTVIRPTSKFLKAGAVLAGAAVIALEILYLAELSGSVSAWLMVLPLLILAWPALHWLRWRYTTVTISGGRLRYEVGLASRSSRTIQLSKVQDVRVDRRLSQRLIDVGDVAIETAGEASRLTLLNFDRPQKLADEILDLVQKGSEGV